jgi:hypothetical protein
MLTQALLDRGIDPLPVILDIFVASELRTFVHLDL